MRIPVLVALTVAGLAACAPEQRGLDASMRSLVEDLSSSNLSVRVAAARVLGDMEPAADPAIPHLVEALKNNDNSAAYALGKIGRAAVPSLIVALKDENWRVREQAAFALGRVGPQAAPESVPALAIALQDENWAVREDAANALMMFGPTAKNALPALQKALNDDVKWVRLEAAGAIGVADPGATNAVRILVSALVDGDAVTRQLAANRLAMVVMTNSAASEAVPALLVALQDEEKSVRSDAAISLGLIAPAGVSDSRPALVEALQDEEEEVRRSAQNALNLIDRPQKVYPPWERP